MVFKYLNGIPETKYVIYLFIYLFDYLWLKSDKNGKKRKNHIHDNKNKGTHHDTTTLSAARPLRGRDTGRRRKGAQGCDTCSGVCGARAAGRSVGGSIRGRGFTLIDSRGNGRGRGRRRRD